MKNDRDNLKILFIKRRIVLIKATYLLLTLILIFRLFKLQIIDFFLYNKKSKKNYIREEFLIPKRGIIYDRNMKEIANNKIVKKLVFFTRKKNNIEYINDIYRILGRPKKQIESNYNYILKHLDKNKKQKFILAKQLKPDEYTKLKFNIIYNNSINIETLYTRNYPYKNKTSTIIGFVSSIKYKNDKIARLNDDYKIGISGIEKTLESKLSGKIGLKYNIINVHGKKINEELINKEHQGKDFITSIDQNLQNKLSEMLDGKNGCATLLDINTGAILAMSSTPNLDPNQISYGFSHEDWNDITTSIDISNGLFLNKNISSVYPPGSTFKIISSLVGLMNGLDPKQKYKCTGYHKIGNRVYHCYKHKEGGHGWVNLDQAIAQSCNCYFYNLSQQISEEDLYNVAHKFGLGEKHLFDFDNEIKGLIPNAKWKKNKEHLMWFPGDTANMTIGQGYTIVTPLQLAIMVARLASNKKVEPRYLLEDEKQNFENLNFNNQYIDIVKHGLFSVINADYGIIRGIVNKKYQICGKTGSAQVVSQRIDNKDMKSGKVSIEKHSHALFVGFAPYDNPKYAISVVIEHGIGGAYSAAPIGTRILVEALKQNYQ